LTQLEEAQKRDHAIIEAGLFDQVMDERRKRSLKFRATMRSRREKIFQDPFHKPDRSFKNENKVTAAKRRKRDDSGKFNLEQEQRQLPASDPDGQEGSEPRQVSEVEPGA
jgi:hypothetical protein